MPIPKLAEGVRLLSAILECSSSRFWPQRCTWVGIRLDLSRQDLARATSHWPSIRERGHGVGTIWVMLRSSTHIPLAVPTNPTRFQQKHSATDEKRKYRSIPWSRSWLALHSVGKPGPGMCWDLNRLPKMARGSTVSKVIFVTLQQGKSFCKS
jgi:hypothetical protein